ncbi:MAG: cation transporter [Bacteroidales bacterium]|nr:cation transporter [Bacteroidales bacterium]
MKEREKKIVTVTVWGAVVNLLLSLVKIVAGVLGNSAAMVADAIHSLSDLISDAVVLVMVKIASKGEDKDHDYGHGKFETMATLLVSVMLLVVAVGIMAKSIEKIMEVVNGGILEKPGMVALWAAAISIVAKEILYQWTARVGKKVNSPSMISNAWHHRSDALTSIGALVGIGFAILLGEKWTVLDPIIGCVISIFILVVAVKMALPALNELMDASLPESTENEIVEIIQKVKDVDDVHGIKTRKIGPNIIIDAHVVVDPDMSVKAAHDITVLIEDALRGTYGNGTIISIHVEPSADAE